MRTLMAPIFWLGRVTLWLVFLPLGLWRSIRHGRKQSEKRQARLIAEELGQRFGKNVAQGTETGRPTQDS
jgi:hypothetical protein